MGNTYKMKCHVCGAYLKNSETGEIAPGNRMREEVFCPDCHTEVYSSVTSGFLYISKISKEEYLDK